MTLLCSLSDRKFDTIWCNHKKQYTGHSSCRAPWIPLRDSLKKPWWYFDIDANDRLARKNAIWHRRETWQLRSRSTHCKCRHYSCRLPTFSICIMCPQRVATDCYSSYPIPLRPFSQISYALCSLCTLVTLTDRGRLLVCLIIIYVVDIKQ